MVNISKNLIRDTAGIIEAMKKLNEVSETLTLFVLDDQERLIGTLTDGDIRRGFINGLKLVDHVESFMEQNFKAIHNGFTIHDLIKIRKMDIILLPEIDNNRQIIKIHDLSKKKSLLPLECVIMAGGRGERLRPLTDKIPKPMLMLGNKPILEHNVDRLIQFGIEKIYITINYLGEQIRSYFGDGSKKGISIQYIEEDLPLGTVGALSMIESFNTDYVLLMNSDLFTDVNFELLYLEAINNNAEMIIASIPYTVNIPYAIFEEENNLIKSLKEKPVQTNYANAGIYVFKKKWVESIPKNKFYNITDLINAKLKTEIKIMHSPIIGYWIDIGQIADYKRAQEIAKHIA